MSSTADAEIVGAHDSALPETFHRADVGAGESDRRVLSRRGILTLGIVVAVCRLIYSIERTTYHLVPDEPASLGMARWLSGSGSWNMFNADVWRPGTALLITPIYWFTDDQGTIIRLSLVLGALIAGWSAVWLVRILTRLTALGPPSTLVISGAIALMPASLSASAFVWAEPLVTLTFLAALWHLMCHVERPSHRHAIAAILWASAGLLAHNRLMPLLALVTLIVVGRSAQLGLRSQTLSAAGVALASVASSQWLMSVVLDNVWVAPGSTNTVSSTLGRLADPISVLDAAVGQIWYLLAASVMLFGIGTIVIVRIAADPHDPRRVDAWLVLTITGALVATSIVFMADRWRTDHLVYGRYNDAVVWPLMAVGAAWIVDGMKREATAVRRWIVLGPVACCGGLTLVLLLTHGEQFERVPAFSAMIAGVQPTMGQALILDPARVAVAAIAVFGLLLLGTTAPRTILVGLTVATLTIAGVATRHAIAPDINSTLRSEAVAGLSGGVIPIGSTVGFRITLDSEGPAVPTAYQWTYWYRYQWFLDDMAFAIDGGVDDDVGPFVFSTVNDRNLIESGAQQVWTDPSVPIALWREPED